MASFYPPNTFFNNINFNYDFYAIPNDTSKGLTLSFANSHYLLTSPGTTPVTSSTTAQKCAFQLPCQNGARFNTNTCKCECNKVLQIDKKH